MKIPFIFLILTLILSSYVFNNHNNFEGLYSGYKRYLSKIPHDIVSSFIFNADTEKKIIALTFDDGPILNTLEIINYLKTKQIPATFFLVGRKISNENVSMYNNKLFSIGMHTYSHKDYRNLNFNEKIEDIQKCITVFEKYKLPVKYFRPAYGIIDNQIRDILKKNNLLGIIWSIDSHDWNGYTGSTLVNHVDKHLTSGDIILFHDRLSISDLRRTIAKIQERGYTLVSLEEILRYKSKHPKKF